jgi:GNAT superfamily N-acetyltransferase
MFRVEPVGTRSDRRAFVELPHRLYRDDPYWVPMLNRDVAEMLDRSRHPFHRHSKAEFFLARDGSGTVRGRIAAIRNQRHIDFHQEPVGFFGFFECERNSDLSGALLDAAATWLRAEKLEVMRGPASFSSNEEFGLLVEGFDSSPLVMMPYNPPWYAELLEEYGLAKAKDLLAYVRDYNEPPERLVRVADVLRKKFDVTIRPLSKKRFDAEVQLVRELYNAAWEKNWGFVPMTEAELDHMAGQLKQVVDPDFVPFAYVRGELAGFALTLPDINAALRHMGGKLTPWSIARGMWKSRGPGKVRVLTLGVFEKFRRSGVAELLYLYLMEMAARRKVTQSEFSWLLEDNHLMLAASEKMGAHRYKTYRVYDYRLNA